MALIPSSFRLRTRRALALGLLTAALVATTGVRMHASVTSVSTTYQVTSVDPGVTTLVVGDRFTIAYTLNESITDTNALTSGGQFPSLATSFVVTRAPANSGSWDGSGTFNLAASNYVTQAGGDHVTFQVNGTGFPAGGSGLAFFDVSLGFTWPFDITDAGSGETFAAQLHGTFGVPPATIDASAIRFAVSATAREHAAITFANANIDIVPAVPTMGPRVLVVLALLLLALVGWQLRRA